MTRVISGRLGGRRLKVPPRGTRPTTDRVREAVFSRLDAGGAIGGARVFDAFAGSGALGIEALSRGAARATFVESNPAAARVIEANLRDLGLEGAGDIVHASVETFVTGADQTFDLVFLDPPYDLPSPRLAAILEALVPRLDPGAVVVLEWATRGPAPDWPAAISPGDIRVYGDTSVHFGTLTPGPTDGCTLEA